MEPATKSLFEKVGIHVPDPDYIMHRMNSAKPEDKKAWLDLYNHYKGAKTND